MPNVRQSLYSEIIVTLAVEPQAAVGKDQDELPVATGLPRTWDDIAPGHLVIAQEALDYGWWEAIVIGRTGDMFTLRFRDYPKLPKFVRHRNGTRVDQPSGRITTERTWLGLNRDRPEHFQSTSQAPQFGDFSRRNQDCARSRAQRRAGRATSAIITLS